MRYLFDDDRPSHFMIFPMAEPNYKQQCACARASHAIYYKYGPHAEYMQQAALAAYS